MHSDELAGQPDSPQPLSVAQLTAQVQQLIEGTFPAVWVRGEISGLARPRSGHVYFALKDDRAQIRAVIWRSTAARLRFPLEDGQEVLVHGELSVYPPRGEYQIICRRIEPAGLGALEAALRRLREKLAREGLFDPERKRPLPRFARRIAVVTSPSGAAIHDFLQVLARRWRGADVLVVPTRVQGEGAADEIAHAVRTAGRLRPRPEVIVLTRGGGSLEDLWAFNEEPVVRAVAASPVPTVSAVGHEVDVTLCDLAADLRALTPSEAAERLAPDQRDLERALTATAARMSALLRSRLSTARARLDGVSVHPVFRRPHTLVDQRRQRLDDLERVATEQLRRRLDRATRRLETTAAWLEGLSPLATLARGYSVTRRAADARIIRRAADLSPGDRLITRFAEGEATSRVETE